MNKANNSFSRRVMSFGHAFRGISELISSEPNARIHLAATIITLALACSLQISEAEWCIVLILIALVWAAEAFNTVIERLSDHFFKEFHETARIIKDISAGAVLICSLAALTCGLIIFVPKLLH